MKWIKARSNLDNRKNKEMRIEPMILDNLLSSNPIGLLKIVLQGKNISVRKKTQTGRYHTQNLAV